MDKDDNCLLRVKCEQLSDSCVQCFALAGTCYTTWVALLLWYAGGPGLKSAPRELHGFSQSLHANARITSNYAVTLPSTCFAIHYSIIIVLVQSELLHEISKHFVTLTIFISLRSIWVTSYLSWCSCLNYGLPISFTLKTFQFPLYLFLKYSHTILLCSGLLGSGALSSVWYS